MDTTQVVFTTRCSKADGTPRSCARLLFERISSVGDAELRRYQQAAEQALFRMGITFNVYGDQAGTEKIFPFDIVPRIVPADEWAPIDAGLRQRVHALNLFIDDIYHEQKILKDGVIPRDLHSFGEVVSARLALG